MTKQSRREKIHQATREEIIEIAWDQIAEAGAPALSLRGIARQMGLTAPALYRYFSDRDALVTTLIIDAFTSLGDSQQAVLEQMADQDSAKQLYALGIDYRRWAITYPQRYQLIFGTPIPGYEAPLDETMPAASKSLIPLIGTIQALHSAGRLGVERYAPLSPELKGMLSDWSEFIGGMDLEVLYTAYVIWSRAHGLCLLEIGSQHPIFITSPEEIFRREIENFQLQYLSD